MKNVFEAVDHYIEGLLTHEDAVLKGVVQSLMEAGMPQISVSANQGKLLNMLALLCRAKKILEIGTLGGYSTIWLARALPADGKLVTIELEPKHAEVAHNNIVKANLDSKVEFRVGKASEILLQLKEHGESFDLIFIDADKPSYPEYLKLSLQLSHSGTLIVADNVVRYGEVVKKNSKDENVIGAQHFNTMLSECKDVTATILQTVGVKGHDGIALAIVK